MIPLMHAAFDNAEKQSGDCLERKRWTSKNMMNLLQMVEMFVCCFLVVVSQINNCHSSDYILGYSLLCINFSSIK